MTDTFEAAQLADMICGCANREQHRRDVKLIEDYVAARITAHTKALIEGAGELERKLRWWHEDGVAGPVSLIGEAAATIAAQKAEIERLTELAALLIAEYDPYNHLIGDGCEHGIKPAKACPNEDCRERKLHCALDAEAIAKGEG